MELSYIQKNNLARARVKLEKASSLIQEADDILDVLCKEAIEAYQTVEDFELFVEQIPPESFHSSEMKVRLKKMKEAAEEDKKIGVHANHCCTIHGCKYGQDDTCPVVQREVEMRYQCEECAMNSQLLNKYVIINDDDGVFGL